MSDNSSTRILSTLVAPSPWPAMGDQAFLGRDARARLAEMTYGGALSFLRRPYSRDLDSAKAVVCGVPFDGATSNRPGARLGPRAIRADALEVRRGVGVVDPRRPGTAGVAEDALLEGARRGVRRRQARPPLAHRMVGRRLPAGIAVERDVEVDADARHVRCLSRRCG